MRDRILASATVLFLLACSDTLRSSETLTDSVEPGTADSSGLESSNGAQPGAGGTPASGEGSSPVGGDPNSEATASGNGTVSGATADGTTTDSIEVDGASNDSTAFDGTSSDSTAVDGTSSGAMGSDGTSTATDGSGATEADGAEATEADGSGAAEADGSGATEADGSGATEADGSGATEADGSGATGSDSTVPDMIEPLGDPTCVVGLQTGDDCNPGADTQPCERGLTSCECGTDSTWTCTASGADTSGDGGDGADGTGTTAEDGAGGAGTSGDDGAGGAGGSAATDEIDCDAQMPTSGAQQHSATWAEGGSGNLAWQVWTNGGPGNLTTYDGVPAFTASWNNSGDYLGRLGFEWGGSGKKYTEYGTIKADYVWNTSGSAGQYSYVGVYGWSNNPCIEWYIVEDSFHQMPFNTGDRPVGTTEVDGGTYNLVYRHTSGTGGDRCGGAGSWDQFYSIRLEGKRCGTITISDHFDAWAAQGWNLGNLVEVKIVVEAAGGQGSVEFPVANVTTSM